MRFLIDECLHESLVGVAHGAGFEATHVNHLGLSGKPDWELADRIAKDEFTFVTTTASTSFGCSAKWIARGPHHHRAECGTRRPAWPIRGGGSVYLAGKELINSAIEVGLKGKVVECVEYRLPTE